MAEVIVDIKANTGQATDSVNDLNNSLNNTNQTAEELELTLKKQEATIKTLDGAVNLVGGSVEILAASLSATGIVSEESAEKFQSYTLAAIAFADGSKRVIDGLKNLNEGLQVYGGAAKAARLVTTRLTTALLANPWVAVATGVVAVSAAIYAYVTATDEAVEAEKRRLDAEIALRQEQTRQLDREERLAAARGAEIEDLAEIRRQKLENAKADIIAERAKLQKDGVLENQERLNELQEEYFDLVAEIEAFEIETARSIRERDQRRAEQRQKEVEDSKKASEQKAKDAKDARDKQAADEKKAAEEAAAAEKKFLDDVYNAQVELTNKLKSEFEKRKADRQALADFEHELLMEEFNATIEVQKKKKEAADKAKQEQLDREQEIRDSISASLAAFSNLAQSLAEVQDETSKEGFEAGKKYKIAQVVTSGIQAAFEAYAGAQKFNAVVPGLGTAIGIASVAAIALASQKAIQDIQSTQFGGGATTPSVNTAGGVPSTGAGLVPGTTSQGGFLALAPPTTAAPPVRAYVVTGDVTDGIEAEQQLQTRRRFG